MLIIVSVINRLFDEHCRAVFNVIIVVQDFTSA